jgi:hypothetical protein
MLTRIANKVEELMCLLRSSLNSWLIHGRIVDTNHPSRRLLASFNSLDWTAYITFHDKCINGNIFYARCDMPMLVDKVQAYFVLVMQMYCYCSTVGRMLQLSSHLLLYFA